MIRAIVLMKITCCIRRTRARKTPFLKCKNAFELIFFLIISRLFLRAALFVATPRIDWNWIRLIFSHQKRYTNKYDFGVGFVNNCSNSTLHFCALYCIAREKKAPKISYYSSFVHQFFWIEREKKILPNKTMTRWKAMQNVYFSLSLSPCMPATLINQVNYLFVLFSIQILSNCWFIYKQLFFSRSHHFYLKPLLFSGSFRTWCIRLKRRA